MINAIIDGMCIAINAEFDDTYEIYTESIEQGLKEPCFSILCLNPTIEHFFGKRYFRTNQFCIHYFPSSKEKRSECYEVMDRLFTALEYIEVDGDPIRGTEMHGEFVDDVLNFFVNYDLFTYSKSTDADSMGTFEHNTIVKG